MHSTLHANIDPREKAIGRKIHLVPGHVTKTVYREGTGAPPTAGASVKTSIKCYLIDGKEIFNAASKQLTVGRGRLIQGLELGLADARVKEKFTLIISPSYAYANEDTDPRGMIPRDQKLVFEMEILHIGYLKFSEKDSIDQLLDLAHMYNQAEQAYQEQNLAQALLILRRAFSLASYNEIFKDFVCLAATRQAAIYAQQKKWHEALELSSQAKRANPWQDKPYLMEMIIRRQQNERQAFENVMLKFEDQFRNQPVKMRKYVEFLKQAEEWEALRSLEGYDQDDDSFYHVREKVRVWSPRIMINFL